MQSISMSINIDTNLRKQARFMYLIDCDAATFGDRKWKRFAGDLLYKRI